MFRQVLPSIASEKTLSITHNHGRTVAIRIAAPGESITIMVSRERLIEMLREAIRVPAEEKETTNE